MQPYLFDMICLIHMTWRGRTWANGVVMDQHICYSHSLNAGAAGVRRQ